MKQTGFSVLVLVGSTWTKPTLHCHNWKFKATNQAFISHFKPVLITGQTSASDTDVEATLLDLSDFLTTHPCQPFLRPQPATHHTHTLYIDVKILVRLVAAEEFTPEFLESPPRLIKVPEDASCAAIRC